jgi:frataxin-like iron-binding protein CyaY
MCIGGIIKLIFQNNSWENARDELSLIKMLQKYCSAFN